MLLVAERFHILDLKKKGSLPIDYEIPEQIGSFQLGLIEVHLSIFLGWLEFIRFSLNHAMDGTLLFRAPLNHVIVTTKLLYSLRVFWMPSARTGPTGHSVPPKRQPETDQFDHI